MADAFDVIDGARVSTLGSVEAMARAPLESFAALHRRRPLLFINQARQPRAVRRDAL